MRIDLARALQTFLTEARDLLQALDTHLIALESDPGDREAVAALFRAVHTIKGSAGMFGMAPIVEFSHIVENLLDEVRAGRLQASPALTGLLFDCGDHLAGLVETVAARSEVPDADMLARGVALCAALGSHLPVPPTLSTEDGPAPAQAPAPAVERRWHLCIRFGPDTFREGSNPLALLRHLSTLGALEAVEVLADRIPPLDALDPEACHLALDVALRTAEGRDTILETFDFVADTSRIHALEAASSEALHLEVAKALEEPAQAHLERLVRMGTLAPPTQANDTTPMPRATSPEAGASPTQQAAQVRVRADKLDALIDLVGELVVASAATQQLARESGSGLQMEANALVGRLVEQIRDGALRLRMVAIGETFQRFPRLLRDVARELGKEVDLVVDGADTELDKGLVEKLADPLTHLVRNAVDHGIERPEARIAAGKPARGRIGLAARHESGHIVIEVSDDGRGMDPERILRKARERGLVAEDATPDPRDLLQLVFEPGFSTAEAVTNLSGRGVGMDVVRRYITELRGQVELDSEVGRGSIVRIRLPLTQAIIDGFLVEVSGTRLILPLDTIGECIECAAGLDRGHLQLRGEALPLLRLDRHFGLPASTAARRSIVLVQAGGRRAGLVVDALLGEHQTVIKPLGQLFQALAEVSGSTLLGNGDVALILDVPALIDRATRRANAAFASGPVPTPVR